MFYHFRTGFGCLSVMLLVTFGSVAMDMTEKEERYYQSLIKRSSPALSKTININSNFLKTKLSATQIKDFQNELKTVINTIKDIQERTKTRSSMNVMKSIKTFAFMHYYYGDIINKPILTQQALLKQVGQLYDRLVAGKVITDEVKSSFVGLIISQLFREVDRFFDPILKDRQAKTDRIDFFYPVVEIAGNVIPILIMENKNHLVEQFGNEAFASKQAFLNKFNQFLTNYYKPEEQFNGLLDRPWVILTDIVNQLNSIKLKKPELYKQLGERLLNALNQGLACYLSVAGDFLMEAATISSLLTDTPTADHPSAVSSHVLITEFDSMQQVSQALGEYLEKQCKAETGEDDLDLCLEKFMVAPGKYQPFCKDLPSNFLSDYLEKVKKSMVGRVILLEVEQRFKREQEKKILDYIHHIHLSRLCSPETLNLPQSQMVQESHVSTGEKTEARIDSKKVVPLPHTQVPARKEPVSTPQLQPKKEPVKPGRMGVQSKVAPLAPIKKSPTVIPQQQKEKREERTTPPSSLKDRIKFFENLKKK